MEIKNIVEDVVKGYIRKMAYKKHKPEDKIQVVLYLKKADEVGVYLLEEYKVSEDEIRLKDILGVFAMSAKIVNSFISKSLKEYAIEYDCDFSIINCMIWLENDIIRLYLYNKHNPVKAITLDDLLKE